MKKIIRIFSCFLLNILLVQFVYPVTSFADNKKYAGNMFTDNKALSDKLDTIFNGSLNLFYNEECTNPVNASLGTQAVSQGITLYVGPENGNALNSGETCWIYANAVYYTLFNEVTGNGTPGENSVSLDICQTNTKKMSFSNFQEWNVRLGVGALVRISTDDWAHSFIIFDYNSESVIILDGNGDGHGSVSITNLKWEEANQEYNFKGDIIYIIQPTDDYYEKLYPSYMPNCTFYQSTGEAEIKNKTNLKSLPCSIKTCSSSTTLISCKPGDIFYVCGLYKNTDGNYWYKVKVGDTYGYIYAGDAKFTDATIGLEYSKRYANSYFSVTGSDLCTIDTMGNRNLFEVK